MDALPKINKQILHCLTSRGSIQNLRISNTGVQVVNNFIHLKRLSITSDLDANEIFAIIAKCPRSLTEFSSFTYGREDPVWDVTDVPQWKRMPLQLRSILVNHALPPHIWTLFAASHIQLERIQMLYDDDNLEFTRYLASYTGLRSLVLQSSTQSDQDFVQAFFSTLAAHRDTLFCIKLGDSWRVNNTIVLALTQFSQLSVLRIALEPEDEPGKVSVCTFSLKLHSVSDQLVEDSAGLPELVAKPLRRRDPYRRICAYSFPPFCPCGY